MWVKRTLKWMGLALLGIAGLAVIAVLSVYIVMGRDLTRSYDIAGEAVPYPASCVSPTGKLPRCTDISTLGKPGRNDVFQPASLSSQRATARA